MTTVRNPGLVSEELVVLTRSLGERSRDLVVLAEGNTSQLLPDRRVVVKASGSNMRTATAEDFVAVDVDPLVGLMASATASPRSSTSGACRRSSGSRSPAPSCSPGAWSGPAAPRDRPCTWATGWTTTSGPRPRWAWAPCGCSAARRRTSPRPSSWPSRTSRSPTSAGRQRCCCRWPLRGTGDRGDLHRRGWPDDGS